jgi:protein-S-isoprenylcysteine O-methyltransferase Ste14
MKTVVITLALLTAIAAAAEPLPVPKTWWALIPAGLCILLIVVRTQWEDRTLHAELPGYAAYARRVRFRLVPGMW